MPAASSSLYFCAIECQERFQEDVPLIGDPRVTGPTTITDPWTDLTGTLANALQERLRPYLNRTAPIWPHGLDARTRANVVQIRDAAAAFDDGLEGEGLEEIATGLAALVHEVGGVNFAGHHWCFTRGHNGVPVIDPPAPGQIAYLSHLSARPGRAGTASDSGPAVAVTAHQPCCPRTSTVTAAAPCTAAPGDFADAMDEHTDYLRQDAAMALPWQLCSCLAGRLPGNRDLPEAPVDIVFISGDDLVREYWEVFRAHHFQVRVMNPLDWIPGPEDTVASHIDLWTLRRSHRNHQIEFAVAEHDPASLGPDRDTNRKAVLVELIATWRR
ncbi:hypothetical protein K3N28_05835 [Glycomyces sp. TRM65418]|uniref:hypothetical protein n=1 Tax=Glycomyces sp. TRM65418 TaxID=2867006 RepID=UPI001CE65109|nr:hypothetical protein [Glycomyces sp. TRM65418]MCC3762589.1 hypothetical protein [Glycomyces sp. TRM65418]QZD56628.1 hypothetical protein K3N28_05795 [Glycomyces sp. TRM65418]